MAKDTLGFSLEELEAFLSGEDYALPEPTQPAPEPTQPQPAARPMPQMVEVDKPTFVDVVRGRGVRGGQQVDFVQTPATNSFVGFLARHYRDQAQRVKNMLDKV